MVCSTGCLAGCAEPDLVTKKYLNWPARAARANSEFRAESCRASAEWGHFSNTPEFGILYTTGPAAARRLKQQDSLTGGAKEQNAVAGKYDPGAAPPLPPDGTAHHGRAVPENDLDAVRGQPLAQALSAAGAQVAADPQPVQTQLTVVEDPAWAQVPDALSGPLLLVAADSPLLSSWTDTLAERGYYRDFSWKNRAARSRGALPAGRCPACASGAGPGL